MKVDNLLEKVISFCSQNDSEIFNLPRFLGVWGDKLRLFNIGSGGGYGLKK